MEEIVKKNLKFAELDEAEMLKKKHGKPRLIIKF